MKWLRKVLDETNTNATSLSRLAGVAHTTIANPLKDHHKYTLSTNTIAKICRATGLPPPEHLGMPVAFGFSQPALKPLPPPDDEDDWTPDQALWEVRGNAMAMAGYLPGDKLKTDATATAADGQPVVAQIYNDDRRMAETVVRILKGPFLISAPPNPLDAEPQLIDGKNVKIIAAVTRMWRDFPGEN